MDKRLVMILNGVIGDTYGCPIEMLPMEIVHQKYGTCINEYIITEKVSERMYTYTDDSEMTLAVLDTIYNTLVSGELNENMVMNFFIKRFEPTRGYSSNVMNMFLQYIDTGKIIPRNINTNGGLMRISPVSLITEYNEDQKIYELVKLFHYPTHVNEESYHVSYIYVKILTYCKMQTDISLNQFIDFIKNDIYPITKFNISQKIKYILDNINTDEFIVVNELIGLDGIYCYETLSVALWGVIENFHTPEKIIGKIIGYGGDCDTIASIGGQLAGIIFGENSLNKVFLDKIESKSEFVKITENIIFKYYNE